MHKAFRFALPTAATAALAAGFLATTASPAAACSGDSPYIGSVCWTAASWCPQGTVQANGQELAINQNQALYALLGTIYGGNGVTTFALPDLRGRAPIGWGQGTNLSPVQIGQKRGTETQTLTMNNLPPHNHTLSMQAPVNLSGAHAQISTATPTANPPTLADGDTAYLMNASGGAALKGLYTKTAPAAGAIATLPVTASGSITIGGNTGITGTGVPVSTLSPQLAMTPCVVTNGLYPTRP